MQVITDCSVLRKMPREELKGMGRQIWKWLWIEAPAPILDTLIEEMGKEVREVTFTDTLTRNIMEACGLYNSQKVKEILDASN